jgi:hypothetical protein
MRWNCGYNAYVDDDKISCTVQNPAKGQSTFMQLDPGDGVLGAVPVLGSYFGVPWWLDGGKLTFVNRSAEAVTDRCLGIPWGSEELLSATRPPFKFYNLELVECQDASTTLWTPLQDLPLDALPNDADNASSTGNGEYILW